MGAVNSLPLEELTCNADIAVRNAPVQRGMKTLKTINGEPAGKYGSDQKFCIEARRASEGFQRESSLARRASMCQEYWSEPYLDSLIAAAEAKR